MSERKISSRNVTNETTFNFFLCLNEEDEIVKAEKITYVVSTGSTSWAHPTYSEGESFNDFDDAEEYFYQLIREESELLEYFDEDKLPSSRELENLLDKEGKFEIPYVKKYDKASNVEYFMTVIISKSTTECELVDNPEIHSSEGITKLALVVSGRNTEMIGFFGLEMVDEDGRVSFGDLDGELYQASGFSWTIPDKVPVEVAEYAESVCSNCV